MLQVVDQEQELQPGDAVLAMTTQLEMFADPVAFPCRFMNGEQALTCQEHGGFYDLPKPGEKPNRAGYVWRDCTKERKLCEVTCISLRHL